MLQLRFVGTEKPPIWLVEELYVLGSGPGCHISLSHSSVKPRHAELSVVGEQVSIRPIGEGVSVLVDGAEVSDSRRLEHGMSLQLGEYRLQIVDPKRERERPATSDLDSSAPSSWTLQSKSIALANKMFPIDKDMIVGRARECDLSLAVAHLSRRHARLFFQEGALWAEDLGSANGTCLNGRRIERARVQGGDELAFDTLVFSVRGPRLGVTEMEDDKTSLRPAIMARPSLHESQAKPAEKRNSPVKPPSQQRSHASVETSSRSRDNSGLMWIGIAAVVLLTGLAIFYFVS